MSSDDSESQNTRQQWQRLVHKYKATGADVVSLNIF